MKLARVLEQADDLIAQSGLPYAQALSTVTVLELRGCLRRLPGNLIAEGQSKVPQNLGSMSYYDHILSVFPDNILTPLSTGNVLSILLVAAACGLVLAAKKDSENIQILHKGILGLQELFFTLIKALVWTLPLGIVAFSA